MRGGAFGTVLTLLAALSLQAGEFSRTCEQISVNGNGQLSAICRNVNMNWISSGMNLNFYIGNIDGRLTAGGVNFAETCRDIKIQGVSLLAAICRTRNQQDRSTSLNLDEYVANYNGFLRWESCSAIPIHPPQLPKLF